MLHICYDFFFSPLNPEIIAETVFMPKWYVCVCVCLPLGDCEKLSMCVYVFYKQGFGEAVS